MAAAFPAAALPALSPFPSRSRRPQLSLPALAPSPVAPSSPRFRCSFAAGLSHQLINARKVRFTVNASAADGASETSERWLFEPVGDGDCRHLGVLVSMPGAFEIASDVVTVGGLPEKANIVIPVATVSGLHARLEKKEGTLLVTDLDSTNGTFIDGKKLRPGAAAAVLPGSSITFGDKHLAIFRVSKLQDEKSPEAPADSEIRN